MTEIAPEHRVSRIGVYNRSVYTCPDCGAVYADNYFDVVIGFSGSITAFGKTLKIVAECPKCGARWWNHAYLSTYQAWAG